MANANTPAPKPSGKSRIIWVIIAFVILLVSVGGGIWYLKKRGEETAYSAAHLRGAPRIASIPGVGRASEEYIRNIKAENLRKAQEAAKTGGSAVPTLIARPAGGIASAEESFDEQNALETSVKKPTPPGCDPQELERARMAGVKVDELRCKGCDAQQLKVAGYTAGNLRQAGLSAKELREGGYAVRDLKDAGYTAKELKEANVSANELKAVGYSAAELKDAGYAATNLINAGYTPQQLQAAGYTANELKASGVSIAALKKAGYTAAELKKAGFNGLDLKEVGFTAPELVAGGLTDEELYQANVTTAQIKQLRAEIGPIRVPNECRPADLRQAKIQGISAEDIKKKINCGAVALKTAGYTVAQLKAAGFSPKELAAAGFSGTELSDGGLSPGELRSAGISASDLKKLGYTAGDLLRAGYAPVDLAKLDFSPAQLHAAGIDAENLKLAGMKAADLKLAGYSQGELVRGAFAPAEISPPPPATISTPPATTLIPPSTTPATTMPGGAILPTPGLLAGQITTPQTTIPSSGTIGTIAPPAGLQPGQVTVPLTTPIPVTSPAPTPSQSTVVQAPGMEAEASPLTAALPDQDQRMQDILERMQVKQEKRLSQQQRQELLKAIQSSMSSQAGDLFSSWSPPPAQQYVRGEKEDTSKGGAGQGAGGPQDIGQGGAAGGGGGNIIKAGTIMFAVLDTGINSDEQSPILATIVQGPLKGGKLLGQFSRVNKKVVLSFNVLSVPSLPNSLTLNAVAIDPDTARTALASSVDSHYMLRYGTLFASTFLAGLGEAILQSGATTVDAPFGQSTTQNPTTSVTEKGLIALGNVGNQYSRVLGQNFQRPPTVKVNPGAGIGILLMADLSLPAAISVPQTPLLGCTTNPCS